MEVDARVEAWASLQLLPQVPARSLVALLKALGGPEEVLRSSRSALGAHVPASVAARIAHGPEPAALAFTLEWLRGSGNALIAWDDAHYPQALLTITDPPPVLFYRGDPELLNRPALAIVGSRNATAQGRETAEAFATALSAAGLTIVSGLALGIDAAAHRGGLAAAGRSLAVVGTGIDRVYPARNRDLAHRLAEQGGIVSEFSLGTPPLPGNFPRRNRLISGLARGVLVIEATLASGSLITARFAAEQGRDVFAIPGSIHSPFSKGSHRLIKDGAKLVESAQDVLEEWHLAGLPSATPAAFAGAALEGNAARVLSALGHDPGGVDALVQRCGLAADAVSIALVELELAGEVESLPGGLYQRLD
ncbi:MAG: DNA-processing protein DprA [Betaproteobacteria bacterium]